MNQEEIFEIIVRHTCEVIPALKDHQFKMDDALKDHGANSIDRSEIVMMTLETLSLNIPMIEIAGAENIGELASILHEKSSGLTISTAAGCPEGVKYRDVLHEKL